MRRVSGWRTVSAMLLGLLAACGSAEMSTGNPGSTLVDASIDADIDASMPRDAALDTLDGDLGTTGSSGGGLDAAPPASDAAEAAAGQGEADSPSDAASQAGQLWTSPGLPPWGVATLDHIRAVRGQGAARGNVPSVFAKVGDSITAWPPFLDSIGNGNYQLGTYGALASAIAFFESTPLFDGSNCFNRVSDAAEAGWTAADALGPPDLIQQELGDIRPAYAIAMFGTNDLEATDVTTYEKNMTTIVSEIEAAGTVIVLSTIPDRQDFSEAPQRVLVFNQAIRSIVAARHLPWIDLFSALAPLPGEGLGPDLVHPSIEPWPDGGVGPPDQPSPCDLTTWGLQYGFDVRNLLTVQALDRLRNVP